MVSKVKQFLLYFKALVTRAKTICAKFTHKAMESVLLNLVSS